jgi:glycosyltransferase involved in cell wall biosynthesis
VADVTRARALRIGVVTTSYPRFTGDAAGSFVAAHVEAMRALGHHVDVVGAHTIDSSLFRAAGAPDELERGRGYLRGAWFSARLAAAIARRVRDWDLIVAHWLVPALAALPALATSRAHLDGNGDGDRGDNAHGVRRRRPRIPLLAIAHGGDVHTLRRLHLLHPALHLLRAAGARLAFVSDDLRALANAPDAIVQPMGIDLAHFAALGRAPVSPPTLLLAARLVPIKGVDVALAALPHVRTPVHLVIAGDGPERARLASLVPRGSRVSFVGAVDARARDQLLREAALVVVPSRVLPNGRSEGTPMIALEALAAGVPVVASAVGGLAALAAATRVRPGDPIALATAIDRVLAAPPPPDELRASVAHLDGPRVAERLLAHAMEQVEPEPSGVTSSNVRLGPSRANGWARARSGA